MGRPAAGEDGSEVGSRSGLAAAPQPGAAAPRLARLLTSKGDTVGAELLTEGVMEALAAFDTDGDGIINTAELGASAAARAPWCAVRVARGGHLLPLSGARARRRCSARAATPLASLSLSHAFLRAADAPQTLLPPSPIPPCCFASLC